MDILFSVLLWSGVAAFALSIIIIPLYYRRFFDPQGAKRALKTSTILLSIGAFLMFFSVYVGGYTNLETALFCSIGFILVLVIGYFIQLFFSNITGKRVGSYLYNSIEDDELAPIDKLINVLKKVIIKKRNGREGG